MMRASLQDIADRIRASRGIAHKTDIVSVVSRLGIDDPAIRVGDDCAAIPDGDGYLLFAIEGFVDDFVAADPRFAGYCGVMVNLSDIAAMGGRALAVVDAIWAKDGAEADPVLAGLREAASIYGVPIVGGHTNHRAHRGQLAVAILGRAKRLITSSDAKDGDILVAAVDMRGAFRGDTPYWDATTSAPPERLRADLELLPQLAEGGLVTAGKDISMAGLIGTVMMLLETSSRGGQIDVDAIPCPPDVALDRFLLGFPSFGFVFSVRPAHVRDVIARFASRDLACAAIGTVDNSQKVRLWRDGEEIEIWDFICPFIGCAAPSPCAESM